MTDECPALGPLRDAFADGQIGEPDARRLREHLDACPFCRRDVQERASLRAALGRTSLPPAPDALHGRIVAALDREDRRWITRWSAAAAAGLVAAVLLLFIAPTDAPAVVRRSSELHDSIVSGAVRPEAVADVREYFRKALGADVIAPTLGCDLDGVCVCKLPDEKLQAPWIVYRRGADLISLLVVGDAAGPMPASARRTLGGRDYHVFRRGANTILCCGAGGVCHVWIARLPESELLKVVLATREGAQAFAGERISIRGLC